MARTTRLQRFQAALSAFAAAAVLAVPFGQASAADDESPFGDAVQVADGALDTMRGGFAVDDQSLLRFGVSVTTALNGMPVASVSVDNEDGAFHFSAVNLGHTVTVNSDGNIQIQSTNGAQTQVTTTPFPASALQIQAATPPAGASPVTFTTTLVPTSTSTTTLASAHVAAQGALLATTTLLPSGGGLLTVVRNVNSNVALNLVQTLNIRVSGLGNGALRNSVTTQAFANAIRSSLHH